MRWFTESPWRRALGAVVVIGGAALLLALSGCGMNVHKDEASGKKNVEITTPFGDLKVKNQADVKETGLPVYPGATLKPSKHEDGDKEQATVSMSLFGMRIAVLSYLSDDPPDKVLAWYREQMKPMGQFVECSGTGDIGKIDMKDEGEKGLDKPVSCEKTSYNGNGRKVSELKLGTEGNQKVVAVGEREDGKPGSQFALVRVVLRGAKGDTL
ncbi:MAG TPA: hypothetical protein VL382_11645 [Terriglobales bacterium]|nr:hypothetical protein [Terriglobales bacterium]